MLLGEYKHNIDAKGRLIIPSKFREDLGERFIVTRGLDGCLFGYPMQEWTLLENKLKQLPLAKKESRTFTRFLYSAATECSLDKQGRINLPSPLINHAALEKTCYIIGVSDRIEIWSEEKWEVFSQDADQSFEEIAEEMIDFGF
ncbi:division/cell wall cluster transcriptional repressor MraZ [Alkalibacterium pelagium]|jgi:MraZ protein|uniref:Transcriptional regulator MraZ n=1 Tax=Alkalibacterium pelagium TaxID=426702 RepID=A0A1H7GYJ8_9LACT|nr:division/cell wall cluster transcriptional repressor MraZ [Alkalibacterium pelagium]GEN49682.1 transcriptional regulator MraZ [Alkalibacterium pelagium]SEK42132.1 MraZ protein [Alkalibacterium pelagium]